MNLQPVDSKGSPSRSGAENKGYYVSPTKGAVAGATQPKKADPHAEYKKHRDKLNQFIDEKISKGKELFSDFEGKDKLKGHAKNYDDTLIKNSSSKKSDSQFVSEAEDFDEYYQKRKRARK